MAGCNKPVQTRPGYPSPVRVRSGLLQLTVLPTLTCMFRPTCWCWRGSWARLLVTACLDYSGFSTTVKRLSQRRQGYLADPDIALDLIVEFPAGRRATGGADRIPAAEWLGATSPLRPTFSPT